MIIANGNERTTTTTLVTVNGTPIKLDEFNSNDESSSAQMNSTVTLETAPKLHKVVLEDISAEEYYKEHTEETTCKIYRFQILNEELKLMIDNSILDTGTAKPYRYLTGNFIRVFEKHVEAFEKMKVPIQKRNNIVYEESARNNTVYMRINGDCKLCPKSNRVKYVFTVKGKPADTDKYVEVETKCRGLHNHSGAHNGSMVNGHNSSNLSTPAKHSRLSLPTNPSNSSHNNASHHTAMNSSSTNGSNGGNERVVLLTKKRKYEEDFNGGSATSNGTGSSGSPPSSKLSSADKNVLNQVVNQISSKIMIKLDQINLKLNQISDRLFDLERKFETIEVAEIIW